MGRSSQLHHRSRRDLAAVPDTPGGHLVRRVAGTGEGGTSPPPECPLNDLVRSPAASIEVSSRSSTNSAAAALKPKLDNEGRSDMGDDTSAPSGPILPRKPLEGRRRHRNPFAALTAPVRPSLPSAANLGALWRLAAPTRRDSTREAKAPVPAAAVDSRLPTADATAQ